MSRFMTGVRATAMPLPGDGSFGLEYADRSAELGSRAGTTADSRWTRGVQVSSLEPVEVSALEIE